MSDQDRNGDGGMEGWHQHMLDQQQKEDEDQAHEDCSFAAAVAIVADYLEDHAPNPIPRESTLSILYTLAGWEQQEEEIQ